MKCKKCLEEKNIDDFYKNCLMCKKCRCLQSNEWRKNNKDKVSIAQKNRRNKNIEKQLKYERELYIKNHKKNLEKARKWRENNREKTREATKKWQQNNLEKLIEYRNKNKEKQKKYHLKWKEKDIENYKQISRKNIKISREKFPEKNKARKILFSAIRVGFMIKPTTCSQCLVECKPEGHHPDYNKPLEVIWLCKKCHITEHKKCKAVLHLE